MLRRVILGRCKTECFCNRLQGMATLSAEFCGGRPITTMMEGSPVGECGCMTVLQRCSAVHQPHDLALRTGSARRKVLAGEHARQYFPLISTADQELHLVRRGQC